MQVLGTKGLVLAFVLASLPSVGCSSEDGEGPGNEEQEQPEEYLGLETPAEGEGFQLRSEGTTIEAGDDVEYCEVAELPGDPDATYYVSSVELANAEFSHHLIIAAAIPGSAADAAMRELDIGDKVPCLSIEAAFGSNDMRGIGGIQQRYGKIEYPAGVARQYFGGQRIAFDYHYYNSGTEAVEAKSAVNFHLTDEDGVEHLARGFGFTNWTIDTPPGQLGSFTAECSYSDDVMVGGLTRHTHRWGTDYSVWFAGGERDGEHIWTSTDWQHDVDYKFDEPVLMKAGEGFRFQCNYDNTESHALRFGVQATDEMCILLGMMWSAGDEREVPVQNCDVSWTDAGGIGRPIGPEGFPKPTADEVSLCVAGGSTGGEPNPCLECSCNACANVIIQCATDADCAPILECTQTAASFAECQGVIDEHSSATGLIRRVGLCSQAAECAECG